MKKVSTILLAFAMLQCSSLLSQRYLTEVFDEVEVTSNVTYGVNATVIAYQQFGTAIPQGLLLDIYEPANDELSCRPLVLYFHTGNFLPHPQNGGPTGTKTDSAAVEVCSRLARMGYVVASCDYRLGWNPIAETQEERVNTLINAAYRGVQDSRTAARFFRRSVAEQNNPYGIDPERIVIWGQGTGGYIAFASSTINTYADIVLPKFTRDVEVPPGSGNMIPVPMVLEQVNGNPDGTNVGINPLDGDTLCYPNHIGYDSNFSLMVNMGGALGDSSWVTANDIPMISFHAPTDPFAPYNLGTVIVPGLNLPVVEVSGSYGAQKKANELGLNDVFLPVETENDLYTQAANLYNNGYFGLYPLNRPATQPADSAPWEWWNESNPNNAAGLLTNPDMSATKAKTFCDTIIAYSAPRLFIALDLADNECTAPGESPENDYCSGAIDISEILGGAGNVAITSETYTNENATGESNIPTAAYGCFGDGMGSQAAILNNSVWFTFEGDGNAYAIAVTNCGGTGTLAPNEDSQMAVYTGTCGALVSLGCNEDIDYVNDIYNAGVGIQTVAGTTYYILVDGFDYGSQEEGEPVASGTFCLTAMNVVVSVDEIPSISDVTVYPNPSNGQFVIDASNGVTSFEVVNLVGSVVYSKASLGNVKRIVVDEAFAPGVYLLNTYNGQQKTTVKMIVE